MEAITAGRSASEMPGLDLAEQKSWQSFLDAALRLYATLNRRLSDSHELSLVDVRVLEMLDSSADGSARMRDLAETLISLPSRLTRQVGRLEAQGLVRRGASPDDRRGVVAIITDDGRAALRRAMLTYAHSVRAYFLSPLTRSQLTSLGENCGRISTALQVAEPAAKFGRM
ncbi:MarR family winged helix-turn-helix transcriptional regulator [Mycobacterium sp. pUA109]|uniref:MarR family winged helix-turn-helix transcriptional regulator n=1 Tax=Mycobacterium sp. pUA109 TaxID=3238982 RepID=UPI00351B067C